MEQDPFCCNSFFYGRFVSGTDAAGTTGAAAGASAGFSGFLTSAVFFAARSLANSRFPISRMTTIFFFWESRGMVFPFSQLETETKVVPIRSAKSFRLNPNFSRQARILPAVSRICFSAGASSACTISLAVPFWSCCLSYCSFMILI